MLSWFAKEEVEFVNRNRDCINFGKILSFGIFFVVAYGQSNKYNRSSSITRNTQFVQLEKEFFITFDLNKKKLKTKKNNYNFPLNSSKNSVRKLRFD